jgi:hypothetical protein
VQLLSCYQVNLISLNWFWEISDHNTFQHPHIWLYAEFRDCYTTLVTCDPSHAPHQSLEFIIIRCIMY